MAGSGKRSDSKKPSLWKGKYFGKHGFKSKNSKKIDTMNVGFLDENLTRLNSEKLIIKENEFFSVDLVKLGFNKLLSGGKVRNKYKIKTDYASKRAIEKARRGEGPTLIECFTYRLSDHTTSDDASRYRDKKDRKICTSFWHRRTN